MVLINYWEVSLILGNYQVDLLSPPEPPSTNLHFGLRWQPRPLGSALGSPLSAGAEIQRVDEGFPKLKDYNRDPKEGSPRM